VWAGGQFNEITSSFHLIGGDVYVLVHGWSLSLDDISWVNDEEEAGNPVPLCWNDSNFMPPWNQLATAITTADPNSTVLMFSWLDYSATIWASESQSATDGMGFILASALPNVLQSPYFTGKLHIIGFSHGCEVAARATATMQGLQHVDQLTLIESPENDVAQFIAAQNKVAHQVATIQNIGSGAGHTVIDNYFGDYPPILAYGMPCNVAGVLNQSFSGWHQFDPYTARIFGAGRIAIPWVPSFTSIETITQLEISRGTFLPLGNIQGSVSVSSGGATLNDASPAIWNTTVTLLPGDCLFSFSYQFTVPGSGNELGVLVDNQPRQVLQGNVVGTNQATASISVSDLTRGQHDLAFVLYPYGTNDASVVISNFTLASIPMPLVLSSPAKSNTSGFQFFFANLPGETFKVFASPSLTTALTNWTLLGNATEFAPSQYQFADPQATNVQQRFYRVTSP
jgi:hypothetical protein